MDKIKKKIEKIIRNYVPRLDPAENYDLLDRVRDYLLTTGLSEREQDNLLNDYGVGQF